MAKWTDQELSTIDAHDDLHISTARADGSIRKPVIIWSVRVGSDLYVRAVRGVNGLWYRHAMEIGEGEIDAGGVHRSTRFTPIDDEATNRSIDEAFRSKYSRFAKSIVDSTVTDQAREATLRVDPK